MLAIDQFATRLLPDDFSDDYRAYNATGDGNCLYNSISICLAGNESLAPMLRRHCADELSKHAAVYANHPHIQRVAREIGETTTFLWHNLLGEDSLEFAGTEGMLAGLQFEGNCTATPKRWGSLVNVLALSTVLQEEIISIFPDVPLHFRTLVHTTIKPARKIKAIKHPQKHRIAILWSRDGGFDTRPGSVYQPNHVVPVLKRNTLSMKRSTQATMSMFLKPTKHAKPCVTMSCSDLSSDSSQPIAVDTNVPDNLRWSTASATQPHNEAHSDSSQLTSTQSLEDTANDAGQQMSAHQTHIEAGSNSGQPITTRKREYGA